MITSDFENTISSSKLYRSNQIEATHFYFVIENFHVFDFSTLIFSQKTSTFVRVLKIAFMVHFKKNFSCVL